jgi:hypothetical protein
MLGILQSVFCVFFVHVSPLAGMKKARRFV